MDLTTERYCVIEIFGRKVLFTNARMNRDDLPDGLFCYDMRHSDEGDACSLEAAVYVNHFGTVLCMTDFGLKEQHSYIPMDYDDNTGPNYLGEEATIEEYMRDWKESDEPLPEVIRQPAPSYSEREEAEQDQGDGLEP